jgi:transcriptional regulator with XRE-family HTH domain
MANSRVPAAAEAPAPAAERRAAPRYGARVRALRLRAGLTQAALARQLGVSASYLNLIERDRRPLPAELLLRLAQALDVDLRAFAAGGEGAQVHVERLGQPQEQLGGERAAVALDEVEVAGRHAELAGERGLGEAGAQAQGAHAGAVARRRAALGRRRRGLGGGGNSRVGHAREFTTLTA